MNKERYFLINNGNHTKELNDFLEKLEVNGIEYETDYETQHQCGILVYVSYKEE